MIILGIDNGHKGAIAALSDRRDTPVVVPMPLKAEVLKGGKHRTRMSPDGVVDILSQFARVKNPSRRIPVHAFVEEARVMPLQAKQTTKGGPQWAAARSYSTYFQESGMILGILVGLEIPYTIVPAHVWQRKTLGKLKKGEDTKRRSIITAKRSFPKINLLPTPRCRKESDGMADAVNIAHYGLLMMNNHA